jgi:hypothetical protein
LHPEVGATRPNDYFISRIGDFASSRRIKLGANPGHKLLEVSDNAGVFGKFDTR